MILITAISQRFQLEATKSIPLYIVCRHSFISSENRSFPFQHTFGIFNFFIGPTAPSAFHYVVQKFVNLFNLFQYLGLGPLSFTNLFYLFHLFQHFDLDLLSSNNVFYLFHLFQYFGFDPSFCFSLNQQIHHPR